MIFESNSGTNAQLGIYQGYATRGWSYAIIDNTPAPPASTYAPNWLSPSMRLGGLLLFGWIGKWLYS